MNRIFLKQCFSKGEIFSVYNATFDENEEDYKLCTNNVFFMTNAHEDTLSKDSITDYVLRLFSACNNMFLFSEMCLKDKYELLVGQKEKLEHVEKTLFKTMHFKLINKNKEEL